MISAKRCDNNLVIIVEDNGEGISEEKAEKILKKRKGKDRSFNGIGVVNVNERIKIYFGDSYGLRFESKKGQYTKCILVLPIVEEEV